MTRQQQEAASAWLWAVSRRIMLERASVQAAHDAVFAEVRRGW